MGSENRGDSFFQTACMDIGVFCICPFPEEGKKKRFAVGGTVVKAVGRLRGLFTGSRVIAFMEGPAPEPGSVLSMEPERAFAVPEGISLKSAAAAARYLDRLNAIRECAAPLCSGYALTKPDRIFEELLDALGFLRTELADADLAVDIDGTLTDGGRQGVRILPWRQKADRKEAAPGADWAYLSDEDRAPLKYPDAYVATRLSDNLKTYFGLIAGGKLSPDASDVVSLAEEPEMKTKAAAGNLSAFHPYEELIAGRGKPMAAVYTTGDRSRTDEELIGEVDSWFGCGHTACQVLEWAVKLGYPDGSIADILRLEGQAGHIELHFDGVTITRVNGAVKLY